MGFIFSIAFSEKRYQQKEQSLILNAGRVLASYQSIPTFFKEETEAKEVNNPGSTLSSSSQTSHLRTREMLKAMPSCPPFTCITNFLSTLIGKLLHTESCAQEEAKVYPAGVNGFTENKKILQSNYLSIKKINKFFKISFSLNSLHLSLFPVNKIINHSFCPFGSNF